MPVTLILDKLLRFGGNPFTKGLRSNCSGILEPSGDLHQGFLVTPCTVVVWASHSANANGHASVKAFATLRTMNRLRVPSPEPFDYLSVALTRPLILATSLRLI
jgi:hypothetical protein